LESENKIFGGHLTLPKPEIVDCGAFCEVLFFHISHKNLREHFSYRLNEWVKLTRMTRGLTFSTALSSEDPDAGRINPEREVFASVALAIYGAIAPLFNAIERQKLGGAPVEAH
jgi:hypothetical protein